MTKARHGDPRKMRANEELRQLAQDHDAAIYMVAVLTARLSTSELEDVVQAARLAAAKLPLT